MATELSMSERLAEIVHKVVQFVAVVEAAKAFVDQSEGVTWRGIGPQLGDGRSSIDQAYNNLKVALAKLEEK